MGKRETPAFPIRQPSNAELELFRKHLPRWNLETL